MKKKDSGSPWTPGEIRFMEKYYLLYPPFEVARRLASSCHTVGRSFRAVHSYMKRNEMLGMDMSVRSFYTATELYGALGVHRKRFGLWQRNGLKTLQEIPGQTFLYVTKADFIEFAKNNPSHLFGIPKSKLLQFLPEELARYIDEMPRTEVKRVTSLPKPVKCLRNGFSYPSVSEAARSNNIPVNTLKTAIARGTKCGGERWVIVD